MFEWAIIKNWATQKKLYLNGEEFIWCLKIIIDDFGSMSVGILHNKLRRLVRVYSSIFVCVCENFKKLQHQMMTFGLLNTVSIIWTMLPLPSNADSVIVAVAIVCIPLH